MENTPIKDVIEYYIKVVFEGDLEKLLAIARESKAKQIDKEEAKILTQKMATSSIPKMTDTYTTKNVTAKWGDFDSSLARCAVPMAMSLFATANFFGNILKSNEKETVLSAFTVFFAQAGFDLHHTERVLLASIFRNGSMHGFFPRGKDIEIQLDPDDKSTDCVSKNGEVLTLNVMALYNMVKPEVYKLFYDKSLHEIMQTNFGKWIINLEGQKLEREILAYKKNKVKSSKTK